DPTQIHRDLSWVWLTAPLVRQALPELRRESEMGVPCHAPNPRAAVLRRQRAVEGNIDFDRVKPARNVVERMAAARHFLGVHHAIPVGIGPTGWADAHGLVVRIASHVTSISP